MCYFSVEVVQQDEVVFARLIVTPMPFAIEYNLTAYKVSSLFKQLLFVEGDASKGGEQNWRQGRSLLVHSYHLPTFDAPPCQ